MPATTAIIGTTWTANWGRAAAPFGAGTMVVRVRANKSLPNGTNPTPPAVGRVLIAGLLYSQLSGPHNGTTGSIVVAIPLQTGFCGLHFAAQTTATGSGI